MDIGFIIKVLLMMAFSSFFLKVYNKSFKKDGFVGGLRKGFVILIYSITSIGLIYLGVNLMAERSIMGVIWLLLGLAAGAYLIHTIRKYIRGERR